MLTKNPPFTKSMESPLCNEALVDQLWKLMNSGKRAVAFKKAFYYWRSFILLFLRRLLTVLPFTVAAAVAFAQGPAAHCAPRGS